MIYILPAIDIISLLPHIVATLSAMACHSPPSSLHLLISSRPPASASAEITRRTGGSRDIVVHKTHNGCRSAAVQLHGFYYASILHCIARAQRHGNECYSARHHSDSTKRRACLCTACSKQFHVQEACTTSQLKIISKWSNSVYSNGKRQHLCTRACQAVARLLKLITGSAQKSVPRLPPWGLATVINCY
jgi:hypothetical protein